MEAGGDPFLNDNYGKKTSVFINLFGPFEFQNKVFKVFVKIQI
jgi:hypothetical protein